MKNKIFTIAILTFILTSCQKENISETESTQDLKTQNNPPPIAKRNPVVTLQTVYLHNTVWISFGWEYGGINDNGGILHAYTIKSGLNPGGGSGGGSNHTWTQTQVYWNNSPKSPNVINIMIVAQNTYSEPSRFGLVKVVRELIIQASFDVQSTHSTMSVSTTKGDVIKIK